MKKIKKVKLKIKSKMFRLAIAYAFYVLTFRNTGLVQSMFYKDEIKQYKEVVEDFGELLQEERVDSAKGVFEYFCYALWKGYLSYDHEFSFDKKGKVFYGDFGIACTLGKAVCRDNAKMLRDLYKSLGYDACIEACYIPQEAIKNEGFSDWFFNVVCKPLAFLGGNHVVTMVNDDGDYYHCDPTNLVYLSRKGLNELETDNGVSIFYKRFISTSLSNFSGIFNDFRSFSDDEYLNYGDNARIDEEKLEEFYKREKELLDEIYEGVDKKNDWLILDFSAALAAYSSLGLTLLLFKKLKKRGKKDTLALEAIIYEFFTEYRLLSFKDVCSYLHYLIVNGYMSYEGDLTLKNTLVEESPSLVSVDCESFGEDFFYDFLKTSLNYDDKCVYGINGGKIMRFYLHNVSYGTLFYSYEEGKFYRLNGNNELVNGDKTYKLLKLNSNKFKVGDKVDIKDGKINQTFIEGFKDEYSGEIEEISKHYSKVTRK